MNLKKYELKRQNDDWKKKETKSSKNLKPHYIDFKREQDIFIKAMLSGGKMAFRWTPP